jgi:uncharacterized protein YjiS (DUF1127 family)
MPLRSPRESIFERLFLDWRARDRDRSYLAQLDSAGVEHLAKDLARPRAELQDEVAKPFWRR